MVHIVLTFDYELPLGGVAESFRKSLFDPTEDLLALAQELDVPLNFFADILCHVRFKEHQRKDFTDPFEKQLQRAYFQGHDVQLHLHPHWLNTEIDQKHFYPSHEFVPGDFAGNHPPNNIMGIVEKGVQALQQIMEPTGKPYACSAYRGGGYVLSPATSEILRALHANSIRIDSSISKGYFFKSNLACVDYTQTPSKANWFLDMQGRLSAENKEESGIFEIPIASKSKSLFETPTFLKMKKYSHRAPEKRGNVIFKRPSKLTMREKIKSALSSRMLSFDNYTYSKDFPIKILKTYLRNHYKGSPIFLAAVSHPKSMGAYSFEMMRHFVSETRKIYGHKVKFTTYTDIKKELNL